MKRRIGILALAATTLTTTAALAEPEAKTYRGVRAAERAAKNTTQVEGVVIKGRRARPLVITEIPRAEVRFEVGTSHYGWQPRRLPRY